MKHKSIIVLAVISAATTFGAAAAQAENWQANLNFAKVGDISGSELELGYNFGNRRFHLTPLVGAFIYKNENSRYYSDTFSNGQTRCRDSSNGHFANDSYCAPDVQAFAKVEGVVRVAKSWEVGAGVRAGGGDTTPYALIGAKFGNSGQFKAFAGKDYAGIGLGLRF